MPEYRRWYVPGGTFFFTLVTNERQPILCTDLARPCLREAIDTVGADWPVEWVAVVLLPDHLHTVWTLPAGDNRYPIRWKRIKEEFTRRYLKAGGSEIAPTASRLRHAERGVWQRRYWEHKVRDEADLKRCVDYIHWNPKSTGTLPTSVIGVGPRSLALCAWASIRWPGARKTRRPATMTRNGASRLYGGSRNEPHQRL